MPQLDKLTFFTQYFWLTIFFFFLYFILINYFVNVIFSVNKLYKHINNFWSLFLSDFNQTIFNDILSKRYTSIIFINLILILKLRLNLNRFNFFSNLSN